MADSTELQSVLTAAENDQDGIQSEPQSEFNSSSPLSTPALSFAGPAPPTVRGKRRFPKRGYFDVRDESKVEFVMSTLDLLLLAALTVLLILSAIVPKYTTVFSSLLTASYILRLFYKWYRVQGGFDTFTALLDDFQPGAIALIIALWGNEWKVIFVVNVFSICFSGINLAIQWFPFFFKIMNIQKFLRAKQFRDRYEDIGISGILPCNEATNEIKKSSIIGGEYYTLENVNHETTVKDVETPDLRLETPDLRLETPDSPRVQKKRWVIGTMLVSYSDNGDWVTIKQKAEDRAVKTSMERFTPQQKLNFMQMMEAWKERPDQGILKKIGRKRAHCFTLARLIDLTNQGFSVCLVKTDLQTIKVGAEVDTCVEELIDSIWEALEVVYNRAARRKSIIVTIIAVVVMFNLPTV